MGFYDRRILPHIIHLVCGSAKIKAERLKVVPQAEGQVLEIGMGSGHNLALYDQDKVEQLWGLEPSAAMRQKARNNVEASGMEVTWLDLPSETIPLADESVDTVVLTFTLCSIADWRGALGEMGRVLKPQGKLLYCEHGYAPQGRVRRWQDRLNSSWKKIAGGCHLNRRIEDLLVESGFVLHSPQRGFVPGAPKFSSYIYWGCASYAQDSKSLSES